jgi:flagellin-like protein
MHYLSIKTLLMKVGLVSENMLKIGRKAISPVIATVILVAVAITVAVSVAYWMGNIAGSYTASEKIEMPSSYSVYYQNLSATVKWDATDYWNTSGWKVYIGLKNSGSRDATITNIFLNEKPLKDYYYMKGGTEQEYNVTLFHDDDSKSENEIDLSSISVSIPKGREVELILWLISGTEGCSSGTTIDLKINSSAGNKYPVLVRLP